MAKEVFLKDKIIESQEKEIEKLMKIEMNLKIVRMMAKGKGKSQDTSKSNDPTKDDLKIENTKYA